MSKTNTKQELSRLEETADNFIKHMYDKLEELKQRTKKLRENRGLPADRNQ